ncbi:MAG: glycoside hydrolase family 3 N-terminal domain-containing protein [Acidimicrobiales bacterium]
MTGEDRYLLVDYAAMISPNDRRRLRSIGCAAALAFGSLVPLSAQWRITQLPIPRRQGGASTESCSNSRVVGTWSLARRAAQLLAVPVDSAQVADLEPAVASGAGGILLSGSDAPANLGALIRSLDAHAEGGIAPFVMTDEEGGEVQRLANLVGSIPWPRTMAAQMSPSAVEALADAIGKRMLASGVTMDLAPVLDIAGGPGPDATHTDGPRSFSPNPAVAARYGLAFARGLLESGVIPVVKHFPGEGRASANTDDAKASTPSLSTLERADLVPFEDAIKANVPAVMVGNATIPGLTSLPASLSPAVIGGLLRHHLGFHGLVLTDSLTALGISDAGFSLARATVLAIHAGADVVLFNASNPNLVFSELQSAIVQAVAAGKLPARVVDGAVATVLAAKKVNLCG